MPPQTLWLSVRLFFPSCIILKLAIFFDVRSGVHEIKQVKKSLGFGGVDVRANLLYMRKNRAKTHHLEIW